MKTIGLLGGMSWESTIPYYRLINEGVKQRLGGLHSASLLLHSVDFHEIEACQSSGEWDKAGAILAQAALGRGVEGGAQRHPHGLLGAVGLRVPAGHPLQLHRHPGYDHSYYFIASFIEAHLRHHAAALNP